VVLDGVVRPSGQQFGYFGPLVSQLFVRMINDGIFVFRPGALLYLGIQVIVPSFSALLADAAFQVASYQRPFFSAIFVHQFDYFLVLLKRQVPTYSHSSRNTNGDGCEGHKFVLFGTRWW
jgi:hypothetical protein